MTALTRVPNPDLKTAIEVLTTGKAPSVPTVCYSQNTHVVVGLLMYVVVQLYSANSIDTGRNAQGVPKYKHLAINTAELARDTTPTLPGVPHTGWSGDILGQG